MSKTRHREPKERNTYAEMLSKRTGSFRGPHQKKNKGSKKYIDMLAIEENLVELEEDDEDEDDFDV